MDRTKIEAFMKQTGLKKALIRSNGQYYFVRANASNSAWENYPTTEYSIEECPPPVELV